MAVAPTLAVAIVGAAFAGVGNGVEAVAARTALQEETEEQWMALMMSFNEALFQSVPGVGILLGGAITALGSPRAALAVAGTGSLAITAAAWFMLASRGAPARWGGGHEGLRAARGSRVSTKAPSGGRGVAPRSDAGGADRGPHGPAPARAGRHQ